MHNLMLRLAVTIAVLTYLSTTTAIAQSLFDFGSKKNTGVQSNDTKKTVTVLSPSDFRNAVNKKAQETNNSITQQVQNQFIKQAPSQPSALPPAPSPSSSPSNTPTSSTAPANTLPPTTAPTPYSSTGNIANSPVLAPPPAPTPTPVAPTTPVQNQPYTGFGTGNTNRNAAPASGSNSGGWNIKY